MGFVLDCFDVFVFLLFRFLLDYPMFGEIKVDKQSHLSFVLGWFIGLFYTGVVYMKSVFIVCMEFFGFSNDGFFVLNIE